MTEPQLVNDVYLRRIITLVDAENVLEYNSIFSSDKQLVHTLRRQIDVADMIIINKKDLVNDSHLSKVIKVVEKYNDKARIFNTIHAQVDYVPLLDGLKPLNLPVKKSSAFKMLPKHSHHNNLHEHTHSSFSRIQTVFIPIEENMPISLRRTEKFLKSWGNQILRAKGYVTLDSFSKTTLIQFAGKHIQWEASNYKGPYYLVIIGFNIDEASLIQKWESQFIH
ncbi:CobW/HypB/UreG, nucleotide-binding domain [compost metagenome]